MSLEMPPTSRPVKGTTGFVGKRGWSQVASRIGMAMSKNTQDARQQQSIGNGEAMER